MEQYAFYLLCYQGKIKYPTTLHVGYMYCQYLGVYVPAVQCEKCLTMFKVLFVALTTEHLTNTSTIHYYSINSQKMYNFQL